MKKIISVVLVVACVCMLFACGADTKDFQSAVEQTSPNKVIITTETVTEGLGTLKGNYSITYKSDGSAIIKYSYQEWNTVSADNIPEQPYTTYSDTVRMDADGNYDDDNFSGVADLGEISLDLAAIKGDVTVSEDGNILTATVGKDNTKAVFGVEYGYDIELTVTKGTKSLEAMALKYVSGVHTVSVKFEFD